MRIGIIGPGALGCLLAAKLAKDTAAEVWLLDHRPERARLLARQGIHCEESHTSWRVGVHVQATPAAPPRLETLLLCVKSWAVIPALRQWAPLINQQTLLIGIANGIGHLDALEGSPAGGRGLGVTSLGATLLAKGRVRFAGQGPTSLGLLGPTASPWPERLAQVAELFRAAGFDAEVVSDIRAAAWRKLLINVGINALTAIHDCPNGGLLTRPQALAQLGQAVQEAATVASAKGLPLPADPVAETLAVCKATAANISSMLQDLRQGRPTEIDAINGAVVTMAGELGLAAPANQQLTRKVKELEARFLLDRT